MNILVLLPIIYSLICAEAIKTVLAGAEEDCVNIRAEPRAEVLLNYEALPDENAKVRCIVSKAEAVPPGQPPAVPKRIRSYPAMHSNHLNLTSDTNPMGETIFQACFGNPSRTAPVELVFAIRADVYESMHDVATKEHALGLYDGVSQLTRSVQKLMDQQHFTISREMAHREVMEKTRNRILRWTVVQALYLGLLCGAQILYIRGMFQSTKTIL